MSGFHEAISNQGTRIFYGVNIRGWEELVITVPDFFVPRNARFPDEGYISVNFSV